MKRLAFVVVMACGSKQAAPKVHTVAGDLVFADVTLVPMDRDTTVAHQTVVVRGDKIVAVAPAAAVDIVAGVTKIDGAGKWLMPGLADMHVHTWNANDLTMFVAAGVTTVRNMFGSEQHLAWRTAIAEGKQLGPTIVTASPILDGEPPVWPGSVVLKKPEDVDGVVAGLKGKGYDFLKPYARLEKPVYDALAAAAKKHGMTLQGHVPKAVKLEEVVAAGQRSIEHVDGWFRAMSPADDMQPGASYWKSLAASIAKLDDTRIPALAELMKKAGAYNCPTLIVTARMAQLDNIPAIEAKWLHLITPEVRATWDPKQDFRLASVDAEDYKTMRAANAVRDKIVRVLATSGAPLIVGTDTGNPYVIAGEAMHDEIELMVAAGAPRPRVLRAATADAATFLGQHGNGVVAVGARADLLLVDVDPMTTPLPLVPAGVVLRGTWLPKRELEAKLAAIEPNPAKGRFDGMPALAGDVLHFDYKKGDKIIGEERVTFAKGVFDAQSVLDIPGRIETTYQIVGHTSKLVQKTAFGEVTLAAAPAGDTLVAKGKAASGAAIDLTAPLPKDVILGGPGIGGAFELAPKLAAMKVGTQRTFASLELATFPDPAIERVTLDVTRKDATKFAITMRYHNLVLESELLLDDHALPLSQSFGPPIDIVMVRRAH